MEPAPSLDYSCKMASVYRVKRLCILIKKAIRQDIYQPGSQSIRYLTNGKIYCLNIQRFICFPDYLTALPADRQSNPVAVNCLRIHYVFSLTTVKKQAIHIASVPDPQSLIHYLSNKNINLLLINKNLLLLHNY
jgi:hypothetical protein